MENGLASNLAGHICQDRQGYIWIATRNGLQRYDGCRFVTWHADIHNPDALQTDWLGVVFEDSRGRLWIGSDIESLYCFDHGTDKFYNYNAHEPDDRNKVMGVWGFLEDGNGDVWVSAKNGFFRLDPVSNRWQNCNRRLGITGDIRAAQAFAADSGGNVWFNTTDGLRCYHLADGKVYDHDHNPEDWAIFRIRQTVCDIQFDGNGHAWFDTYTGTNIFRFDQRANTLKTYRLASFRSPYSSNASPFTGNISRAPGGIIAVSLIRTGLALYQPEKDSFAILPIDNKDPYGLHGNPEIFDVHVLIDRDGNFWVGSDRGINIFNPGRQYFHYYQTNEDRFDPAGIPSCNASGFLEAADGEIFVSYYCPAEGVHRLDRDWRLKERYRIGKHGGTDARNQLWCLFQGPDSLIWAPDQQGTILLINPRTGAIKDTVIPGLEGNIPTMRQDADGTIWAGHWSKGLVRIDTRARRVQAFNQLPGTGSIRVKTVYSLCFDGDSIIWLGTRDNGLLRFNKVLGIFTGQYNVKPGDLHSISSNTVKNILPFNKDTLVIATTAGIDIFDKNRSSFDVISTRDGLPNNFVQSIALDDNGLLWAGTVDGFCRVDIHTRTVTQYDFNDGIINSAFEDAPMLRLRNGHFLVAGSIGFMEFDPDNIRETQVPPPVSITGFRTFDREMRVDSLLDSGRELVLPYTENNVNIDFSALQFTTPGKIRYAYQLEGVDKGWVAAGKEQTARYNQLRSGHYRFLVRCTDRNDIAARRITSLSIFIAPPFWNTWWFYALLFMAISGSLFAVLLWLHQRREEKQLLQLNYEKKIAGVRMNTLRAQMNPHFIFNSLNSINTFILKNDQDNATDYLGRFSQLVRLILDNSRSEWVLLENELRALELYIQLESIRLEHAFAWSIAVDPQVRAGEVLVPPLLVQPFVENAIWHGLMHRREPGGQIVIHIHRDGGRLCIGIADNGVGRAEAARLESRSRMHRRSHGMQITAERLNIINEVYNVDATVTIIDPPAVPVGTKVLLTIQYTTHADIDHR